MKKLSPRYKRWLMSRAFNEAKCSRKGRSRNKGGIGKKGAHHVTAWLGDTSEELLSLNAPTIPPANLCLLDNTEETLAFLAKLREGLHLSRAVENPSKFTWIGKAKTRRGLRRITTYTDFSKISHISTATALVMTAEYHRAAHIVGSAPPAIELHEWNNGIFKPLFQIGFFEAIGQLEKSTESLLENDGIRYLPAVNGKGGDDLERVSRSLKELSETLEGNPLPRETRMELNTAIGEAIINVSKWAYPKDHKFTVPQFGDFWVTASIDRSNDLLTVVIYDQGVSIPVSYPRKALRRKALDYLNGLISRDEAFDFQNDGAYIDCAMSFGNSRSGENYRGQGLPQMKELIDLVGGGSLMVCSRGGLWHYENGKTVQRKSFPQSVGGTLIEWNIKVSEGKLND